ncbi:acyltransferase [Chromobacterium paludis]|uniref:Chloramphenicol acetyltransferase n=1 Tax=Chromobacterium paludis TaxID=2605945 RepID=A0A5C1DJ32_9NEIS|nr:acyltransferase [Chromobacterium paludis]QEL56622.1 acyltransferase [Chromobacterium paludis]
MQSQNLSREQLLALGFSSVGHNVKVSHRAVFHAISGSLGDGARIDDFAVLTGHVEVGAGAHISPFCFLGGTGGRIVMGRGAGLSTHVSIFTKSDEYQQPGLGGERSKVTGDVIIGDYSIFGAQCVVLPGSVVGANCSIGVGCVVGGEVAEGSRLVSMGIKNVRLQ